jgi:multiple sugar transport system ATP-binding protein
MPSVEFRNIHKHYGSLAVLEDLNLSVGDGEFLVLLGPSGCGKTTLLNLLAGLQEVTAGEILIDGEDITDRDPKDRGLAMVFQSYALYPTKTVRGNLRFGLAAQKLEKSEIERRVSWAAELLQITPLMDRKPSQLSGGQRQRVAIGRALVKNVGVFLFDEPLSNLDAKLRTEMRIEIKKLHEEINSTIVYVTHDQIEAMTMATKIAVMDGGVIQQFGTPDEIYEHPANLFVAGFIGAPAMNFVDATIRNADGVKAETTGGITVDLSHYEFQTTPQDGQAIKIGLRPEHFDVHGCDGVAAFELPVLSTERTGSDATIFLDLDGQLLLARAEPGVARQIRDGETIRVAFPAGKANVFDARTGRRL